MSLRTCALIALAVTAVAAGSAHAAPKPKPKPKPKVCNLVLDAKGDADAAPLGAAASPAGNEPAYDIVSGDIASDAKTVTAVIRVAKLAKTTTNSPTGLQWRMDFAVSGLAHVLFLQGGTSPAKDNFSFGWVDTTSHAFTGTGVTGMIDLAKNEVRISAPIVNAVAEGKIPPGAKISGISVSAGRYYNTAGGNPSLSEATDTADAAKSYTAGDPSCVTVGK
jgi:hypothetical protein